MPWNIANYNHVFIRLRFSVLFFSSLFVYHQKLSCIPEGSFSRLLYFSSEIRTRSRIKNEDSSTSKECVYVSVCVCVCVSVCVCAWYRVRERVSVCVCECMHLYVCKGVSVCERESVCFCKRRRRTIERVV